MSDQYSPSTEAVRVAYIDRKYFLDQVTNVLPQSDDEAGADFDRWLASVKAEAWDEGNDTGWDDANEHWRGYDGRPTPNPYREQEVT